MIWDYSVEEIGRGYAEKKDGYDCVMCGRSFEKGNIYERVGGEGLLDAYGAIRDHVAKKHGTTADYLLEQRTGLTGISEVQKLVLKLTGDGKTDKEIADLVGIAPSTVRSHRFKLREKEKQARLFLAMMESLENKRERMAATGEGEKLVELHASAAMIDDRYAITRQEREKTIKTYLDENGALKQFPAREKKKIIVLNEIVKNFKTGVTYTETEVNRILKRIYEEDYPSIRRALIEYGFMDRSSDCRMYRVKE